MTAGPSETFWRGLYERTSLTGQSPRSEQKTNNHRDATVYKRGMSGDKTAYCRLGHGSIRCFPVLHCSWWRYLRRMGELSEFAKIRKSREYITRINKPARVSCRRESLRNLSCELILRQATVFGETNLAGMHASRRAHGFTIRTAQAPCFWHSLASAPGKRQWARASV